MTLVQQLIGSVGQAKTSFLMTLLLGVQLVVVLPLGEAVQRWGNIPIMILGTMQLKGNGWLESFIQKALERFWNESLKIFHIRV
ncbi:MAG: hypothetical protein MH252_14865 [Thermosynechococcaceae cyanobacterium MS004]|nr:hypothetical protein [Thermosynechococcaceae cyanobacterium MS004]